MNTTFATPQIATSKSHFKPSEKLIDNHGRVINYVRIAVTDVCNLRCSYCMPEEMRFFPTHEKMTFNEIERLIGLFAEMGITKVRLTGGEPFVRPDLPELLEMIRLTPGIERLHITTNGVLTAQHLPLLKRLKIDGVNLSLDTLNRERFHQITRRNYFDEVMQSFYRLIDSGIPLRVNCVVMDGINTDDILPLVHLSKDYPIAVRFIEEMPFNGQNQHNGSIIWNAQKIFATLQAAYPDLQPLDSETSATSQNYRIPGHKGSVGIIAGYSRTFCGTCNRLRVDVRGGMQTCLYGLTVLNLRDMIRENCDDETIKNAIRQWVNKREINGWDAQRKRDKLSKNSVSMSKIGG